MQPLGTYIVRIYRHGARGLAGILEDPRSGTARSFETMEDLWRLLCAPGIKSARRKRRGQAPLTVRERGGAQGI